ncbi:hypothetical protein ACGFIY_21080 [Micromonospora chersina]|uniref:hypothetical protein n=1 Tax=Micromonospora chersina TaxID=47854 RepID=UPI00371CA8A4
MAEQSTVDLIAAVVTREATRSRGDETSPYSWGTTLRVAPGHARDTATAVVRALRRAGRLVSAAQLAEFGRYGWTFGFLGGAALGQCAERYAWPSWACAATGGLGFAAGVWAIGWAARRAAGRAESRG